MPEILPGFGRPVLTMENPSWISGALHDLGSPLLMLRNRCWLWEARHDFGKSFMRLFMLWETTLWETLP